MTYDLNDLRPDADPSHQHNNFQPDVQLQVLRDQQDRTGFDIGFIASIGMKCGDCGIDFWWPGMRRGQSFTEPRATPDGLRALLPMRPADRTDMPVDKIPDIESDADALTRRRQAIESALRYPQQHALRVEGEDGVTFRTRAITNALDALA